MNELNNQTIPKSLQESRHMDKNMDVVDLLGMFNHYDKDCSDLARSLNHLEMETLQMQQKNIVLHPPVPESTIDIQWETVDNVRNKYCQCGI